MAFDVETVRKDFPILSREVHGVPLVYLDSANSAQKPQVVIDAEADLYANHYANVARAVHTLGSEVTRPTRVPATRWPRSSTRRRATKSSSPATSPRP